MKNRLTTTTDGGSAQAPYEHLYIYHIEGRVSPTYAPDCSDFIGLWQETDSAFLFFTSASPDTIAELVRSDSGLTWLDSYDLSYDQWHGGRFETFEQGALKIVPAWKADNSVSDKNPSLKTILLHPGVVFGVGTHPTTRDCLAALQVACKDNTFTGILDLGTGTGLLALAAARLGNARVIAVDMNALATKTAQTNVRLNQLEDYVMVIQGNALDLVHCHADLVIANIHYDVMRRLIQSRAFLDKKRFVLSGLMRGEARDIIGELKRRSIDIVRDWQHEGVWFTFYARKRQ